VWSHIYVTEKGWERKSKYFSYNHAFDVCFSSLTDRSNSINNIEKRKLISVEHGYHLDYWFCSRIWNKSINELLSYVEQYDSIFIQSMIWDHNKYHDHQGKFYLENLDTCLSKMKKLNKNIIWISIPPSNSYNNLNKLILNMHLPIMEILKFMVVNHLIYTN
jgi:hypothetical protein